MTRRTTDANHMDIIGCPRIPNLLHVCLLICRVFSVFWTADLIWACFVFLSSSVPDVAIISVCLSGIFFSGGIHFQRSKISQTCIAWEEGELREFFNHMEKILRYPQGKSLRKFLYQAYHMLKKVKSAQMSTCRTFSSVMFSRHKTSFLGQPIVCYRSQKLLASSF